MAYQYPGEGALNYHPVRYGESKLLFRGPKENLDAGYVAFLGGTETYGKYIETPFPDLVAKGIGRTTLNLGCVNAGTDVFLNDETVMGLCEKAAVTVFQVTGAQNMSNRFYAVHPRRNDRFLRASMLMKTIYRNVDFTDYNFTRHLLLSLERVDEESFEMVRQELRDAWIARMRTMVQRIEGDVILLWLSDHSPDDVDACRRIGGDPLFVDREMIEKIRPHVSDVVEIVGTPEEIAQGYEMLSYSDLDAAAAKEMLGPIVHARAARALRDLIVEKY
ncbi:DUF6473 family protein [Celeribacter sp.]|uniref:DUF6473 family protein n=1 Tax=Celeribacter sp. TaxID=1890673 RepID=UPI003A9360C7